MDRREFLMVAAAGGAMVAAEVAAPSSQAAGALDAQAVRVSPQLVRVDWSAKAQPATIWVSSDPDAPPTLMRELKTRARGGSAELATAITPRPYFLLRTVDGAQTRVAERLLPLQGGRNFRDLGGYRAAEGRQVRWGHIYRSGVMAGLTTADMTYLSDLGIQAICDLRSRQERAAEPNPFLNDPSPEVIGTDYDMMDTSGLMKATNRADAINALADTYLRVIEVLTPQYTDIFARLLRREILAFNCSAGKDRTGIAAALILSVLGAAREAIVADYALTEVYTPPSSIAKLTSGGVVPGFSSNIAKAFMRLPPDVTKVMMGSDPAVMRATLARIDAQHGGPIELCKARYGLTDAKIANLRQVYLI
jgi:protein-tyrosine phosphatase